MALSVYAMSCFKLTKHQCKQITSAMMQFWWNAQEDKNKMYWVAWKKVCRSKERGGLGFRDIGCFNQALLAKQAWRLLNSPSSLLARVYKAIYYPNRTFLEAKMGYRPSYAWRSILFGRELLEKGVMKSIGDGKSTSVWLDKWIFDELPRRPVNKEIFMDLNLKVCSLINMDGSWDIPRLHSLFLPIDVTRICSFPPAINLADSYVWAFTVNGQYSVKNGYWFLNREAKALEHSPDHELLLNKIKSRVWNIPTEPKIRMFLWRALSGALAVAECLRSYGLQVNPRCQICGVEEESISHVLFRCTVVRQIWSSNSLPLPVNGFSLNFPENLDYILGLMDRIDVPAPQRAAIPWILWETWKARNSFIFAGQAQNHNILLAKAFNEAEEWFLQQNFHNADREVGGLQANPFSHRWIKPAVGKLKCNIHCSWKTDHDFCGGAWIIRNHLGDVLFHARDAFLPRTNRISAELSCIFWCLQSIKDLRILSCEVWSDCKAALEALASPKAWPKYHSILDKIFGVLQSMSEVSFQVSAVKANGLVRDIAQSVTRDDRLTSYVALGGPSWLHEKIIQKKRASF